MNKEDKLDFEASLPMSREILENLIDCLSASFEFEDCNHDYRVTKFFLENQEEELDIEKIIKWLKDRGGICDCEVLFNLEKYCFQ